MQTRIAACFELGGRFQLDCQQRQCMAKRVVDLTSNPVALADNREFLYLGAVLLQVRVGRCEFIRESREKTVMSSNTTQHEKG